MIDEQLQAKLVELGAKEFTKHDGANALHAIETIERIVGTELPVSLVKILLKFPNCVCFENGAIFEPQSSTQRIGGNDCKSLDFLYGRSSDDWVGILETTLSYRRHDFFPAGFITIGDAGGGNQICLEVKSGKICYWRHDVGSDVNECLVPIAENFATFFSSLRPEEPTLYSDEDLGTFTWL